MFNIIQPAPRYMAQEGPTYILDRTFTNNAGGSIDIPSGTADGDLMIAVIAGSSVSTPTGWTVVSASSYTYNTRILSIGVYKRVASSEGSTLSLPGTVKCAITYRNATDVMSYSSYAWSGDTENTPSTISIPSITASNKGKLLAFAAFEDDINATIATAPSGMTQIDTVEDTGGTDFKIVFWQSSIQPGSSGAKTVTFGGSDSSRLGGILLSVY